MRKELSLIILTVLQSYSLTLKSQDLQFYREDIVFSIHEKYVETDAGYYFCNVGEKDIRVALFYPFPENTKELIDSIMVEDLKTKSVLPYRDARSGIHFEIFVKAYGQSAYRVYFRQQLKEDHFRYILNSTASWGRSLEFANYELQMPLAINPDSLSYPSDTSFIQNNIRYYQWKKTDFMPDRDFEVYFHLYPNIIE
jgi:hypothetical protein